MSFWSRAWQLVFIADPTILGFRTGRWQWPWALLATFAVLGGFTVFAFLGMQLLDLLPQDGTSWLESDTASLMRPGHIGDYAAIVVIWLALPLGGLLGLRLVKGDRPALAFTQTGRFHVTDFFKAALAVLAIYGLATAIGYVTDPGAYQIPERQPDFLAWLALGLVVILVQSASEEIFFRGVLLRIWGAIVPARLVIGIIMAVFIAIHLPNADVQIDVGTALIVFVIGEIIAYWALLRTKCLAAPMGLHWMNNSFLFFLVASVPAGDPDAAIVVYTDPVYSAGGTYLLDPVTHLATAVATGMLALLLFNERSPICLPRREAATADGAVPRFSGPTVPDVSL